MFRLHIDVPLGDNEEDATLIAKHIVGLMKSELRNEALEGVSIINYRLMNDDDRGAKNYLIKDASGHCTNKKSVINLQNPE